ncbi:ATP-binding protein [Streptomyces sp. NPDC048182]|uniref:ATP-binding protein n=1 Tax=Streptomyces sp. NPDC048182 TaxID=3365507 RepID=UPI00371059FC
MGEGTAMSGEDTLRTTFSLNDGGASIAEARHAAVHFLTRVNTAHRLGVSQRVVDLLQLVVSELVTNSRKYAPGPARMDLRIDGEEIEVAVWDSAPALPVAKAPDAARIGQHGLEIVKAVTRSVHVQRTEPVGKRVIARLALQDEPSRTRV